MTTTEYTPFSCRIGFHRLEPILQDNDDELSKWLFPVIETGREKCVKCNKVFDIEYSSGEEDAG